MNSIKMASPLYILRYECEKDLAAVIRKIAEIGYDGIEFLGFFGHEAREVRQMLDENGLVALGNHVPFAQLHEDAEAVLSFHETVGCQFVTVADIPMQDMDMVCSELRRFAALAEKKGIRLLYHNHDRELMNHTDGQEYLASPLYHTPADILAFEPDLGWIEIGGSDPEFYLRRYADRCPVIHLKDYYASDRSLLGRVHDFVPERGTAERGFFEFRPTGYGVVNIPRLMPLCLACKPEWFVMDHDLAYERDIYSDLKLSLEYTRNLLALQAPQK